ncbi:MAG: adenylyltransferase/cytidyltransferase family protein [Candidatus Aminicenantes bacterium]|nr:adenylyltransferase/cytidyltransferase family protein [Candidatus Aminicenantes bacterium]MBL7083955.1 adenylyltransferase/cytidyltransferase family protein [Candidatus Aminicenantes bacterium]
MDKKIQKPENLVKIRRQLKLEGKKVVFTNGCFDILHCGHIHLFREAKKRGDIFIVAVNDDASVKKIKGASRPIFPLEERLEVLEAIEEINYLTFFSGETPQEIVALLLPDVLVKGGDWKPEEVVGKKEVEGAEGKVEIIPYLKGKSSSDIIDRIIHSVKSEE